MFRRFLVYQILPSYSPFGGKGLLYFLTPALAGNTTHDHFSFGSFKPFRHAYKRHMHIVEALGAAAMGTYKMYMVIMMMSVFATAFAQCISGCAIGTGNRMNNALIAKGLQGSVNGHPIHFAQVIFNIAMAKGTGVLLEKQIENGTAAFRYTQAVSF
jgi:hypothetical protein